MGVVSASAVRLDQSLRPLPRSGQVEEFSADAVGKRAACCEKICGTRCGTCGSRAVVRPIGHSSVSPVYLGKIAEGTLPWRNTSQAMSQYVYSMYRVGKIVPPKRQILKDISLSFLPGAKIGILGLNGAGKSTVLRIMAGVDTEIEGEAQALPGLSVGYLPQEPKLDPAKTVRETVEEGLGEIMAARKRLDEIYAAYGDPEADFNKLANEQAKLEAVLFSQDGDSLDQQLEIAADALRLPPGIPRSARSPAARSAASRSAACCSPSSICCCSTSRPTTSMPRASNGVRHARSLLPR
jgi:energy-coupling factor transporter ATP-binding protein EcfA2